MNDIRNIVNLFAYLIILILLLYIGEDVANVFSIRIEAVLIILLAIKEFVFTIVLNIIEKHRVSNMIDDLIKEYKEGCLGETNKLIPFEYYFSIIKFARNILYRSSFNQQIIMKISKFESDLMFQKNNAVKSFDQHIKH